MSGQPWLFKWRQFEGEISVISCTGGVLMNCLSIGKAVTVIGFVLAGPCLSGQSLGCIAAKTTQWYWTTRLQVEALKVSGVLKDAPACHDAVDTGGQIASQFVPKDAANVSKSISNCACDDVFSGDPRLHEQKDYPGPKTDFPRKNFVITALGQSCWNNNNGSPDLRMIAVQNGGCPAVGPQVVEFRRVRGGPWYELEVGGNCINVDENSWNRTGLGVVHLLPCTGGAVTNDQWAILPVLNVPNQVTFLSRRSGGCLDLRDENAPNNEHVQQNFCSDVSRQHWKIIKIQ